MKKHHRLSRWQRLILKGLLLLISASCMALLAQSEESWQSHSVYKLALGQHLNVYMYGIVHNVWLSMDSAYEKMKKDFMLMASGLLHGASISPVIQPAMDIGFRL